VCYKQSEVEGSYFVPGLSVSFVLISPRDLAFSGFAVCQIGRLELKFEFYQAFASV
jgi:hypothetical protein